MTGPSSASPPRDRDRDPGAREVAAVEALLDRIAGDPRRARALLESTGPVGRDEARGRAAFAHGIVELRDGPVADARQLLLVAARLLAPHDRRLALDALLAAAEAAWSAGDVPAYRDALARTAALRPGPGLLDDYRAGMAAVMVGRFVAGGPPLRRAVDRAASTSDPAQLIRGCVAALVLGEVAAARDTAARALALSRTHARRTLLPQILEYLAYSELRSGHHARARTHAEAGLRAAHRAGQRNSAAQHHAILAMAASVEGTVQSCARHARDARALAVPHGLMLADTLAGWALARSELAAGRAREALARLGPFVRPSPRRGHYAARMLAVPCFLEAAVAAGERAGTRTALAEFTEWASWTADPNAPGQLARCRALLAAPDDAEELYAAALAHHDRTGGDFEPARTRLLYGKALRRTRRLLEAREQLRSALVGFERCGAGGWAAQARAELRATGETADDAHPGRLRALTPQQYRVARCVAEGATNREVATRLSVSPRTVEHHLRNIFAALGVRSRVELARLVDRGT